MNVNYKTLALGLGSTLFAVSCSNDEIEQVNRGPEITFNTAVTRAAVETTTSLKEFKVWAQADGYTGTMLIDGQVATKVTDKNYFEISDPVFWPSDVAKINFWAISPATMSIAVNKQNPTIENFTPATNPQDQKDLIVAYKEALRSNGTSINLEFNHALSQIVVKAKRGEVHKSDDGLDETKKVDIKGAWIVNVKPTGTLAFNKTVGADKHYMSWELSPSDEKTYYGSEFDNVVNLTNHDAKSVLAINSAETNDNPANGNNLMLVPQQLDKWDLDTNDKTVNDKKGAYILFLCRVTTEHQGSTHTGENSTGGVQEGENSHIHQLFPFTGKYDENQYGFSCIPIDSNWEPGKLYIYTLEFCGPKSGAGVYPPQEDVNRIWEKLGKKENYIKMPIPLNPETPNDQKKEVGDPVLDLPIRFEVNVENWDDVWSKEDDNDGQDINMK
ncbi:MAG: fimbrillin family protein [Bacteroides sp.]|nr:fimbrillin family protein [Bacteroides sp.]